MTYLWILNGTASDFTSPIEDFVRTYLSARWILTDPSLSTNPPADFATKVRLGDWDYDGFSTYYIKIKEQTTTFDNDFIGTGLFGFTTPILFELTARRLTYGQSYQQLNNMRLEVIRIIGQFKPDDIPGIPDIHITDPGDAPEESTTTAGQVVWVAKVTATLTYFKSYTEV